MNSRIYLDHAATTPMVPSAIEAMAAELGRVGNASSLHGSGRAARRVVEESREEIASWLGARPAELIFTSGGTESDNLAVKGGWAAEVNRDRPIVISTAAEHHAVLDSLLWLESRHGAELKFVRLDEDGRLDLDHYRQLLADHAGRIGLITIMTANNETGALAPVDFLARLGAATGAIVHTDAVQAVGHLPFDFGATALDAASFTAHKLGGPVGVGALLLRRGVELSVTQHGGGQERDLRSGTLDVAAVAAFAAAIRESAARLNQESQRLAGLRDRLVGGALASVPHSRLNGPPVGSSDRHPAIVNLEFARADADAVLMLLDRAGLDCSTGSACTAGLAQPSHVLLAMGRDLGRARSAIRFSLGHSSSQDHVEAVLTALPEAVARARAAGSLG